MKIDLRTMTQPEFDEYREHAVESLAFDLAEAHGTSPEEARQAAQRSFETLVPDGRLPAPDQHLYTILKNGSPVGTLWFCVRSDRQTKEAFVLALWIEPSRRREGIGAATMQMLESLVGDLGIDCIGLNVFEHNRSARALYEGLGYVPLSTQMGKRL